jgi:hypothetical protein
MNSSPFSSPSPVAAAALALGLVVLSFIGGYGYGVGIRKKAPDGTTITPGATPKPEKSPPEVKGLRAAPNDQYVALTAVYDQSRLAARVIVDLQKGTASEAQSPVGWQDYITQWSADSRKILFERERIPRPVADATAGLYAAPMAPKTDQTATPAEPELLTQGVDVPGEKIIAGFWTPNGNLVLKTRREPKSLWEISPNGQRLVDRAGVNFQQHRAVIEKGKTVFYTVRDVPGDGGIAALFRVVEGKATRLSDDLSGALWVYLEERARYMTVCRQGEGGDWQWMVYGVGAQGAKLLKTATVPGDIRAVYWSPEGKHILGAGGDSLWIVDVPSLQSRRLTSRTDWKANDACWLNKEEAVLVAARGVLHKVALSGATRELWRFSDAYWR